MKRFLCSWVALGLFASVKGSAQADYIFTTIDVAGSFGTVASGINDTGQIVGSYNGVSINPYDGFLLSGGSYTTFDVPSAFSTHALGSNNVGQMVGGYVDRLGTSHGFLRSGSSYTTLDLPASFGGM